MVIEASELLIGEVAAVVPGELLGVGSPGAEGNRRADAPKDRASRRVGELIPILVRKRERQAIGTNAGEDVGPPLVREAMKLVHKEEMVGEGCAGVVRARTCCELHFSDEKRSQKLCVLLTNLANVEIGDQNFATVYDGSEVEAAPGMSDDALHQRHDAEFRNAGQDRIDGLGPEPRVFFVEGIEPVAPHSVVAVPRGHAHPVRFIGEQPLE